VQDIRRIVRNDSRIINKLHRRVFMDKISLDDVKIYVSFYCEASNRDAFMAIKQVCAAAGVYPLFACCFPACLQTCCWLLADMSHAAVLH
jgi:hypothetical protein